MKVDGSPKRSRFRMQDCLLAFFYLHLQPAMEKKWGQYRLRGNEGLLAKVDSEAAR
jgi:hypothetical protein